VGHSITWTMLMRARLPSPPLRDGRVALHRDYWDLLGSMMDVVPLAGPVYRAAVALLG
jgi:hypothetical protein